MIVKIKNRDARRVWLHAQGLSSTPTGPVDIMDVIKRLGFVQLDTIRNITRAHHHILWTRNQNYREPMLNQHLENRNIFEHFTHDASVIPMEFYPIWKLQFDRLGQATSQYARYKSALKSMHPDTIKQRIFDEGPLCTRDFATDLVKIKGVWNRPPHKIILDQMWYAGHLSTSHRDKFIKYYDVSERIIPPALRMQTHSKSERIDWLCTEALKRLGFGTHGEIQKFWGVLSAQEVRQWAADHPDKYIQAQLETADGIWKPVLACPTIEQRLQTDPQPTKRLRILNPFDPAVRDRKRLSDLFGFEYRIEIFIPAAQRKWGYYVYPILEGDKLIARIDAKAQRNQGQLLVKKIWPEAGVEWTSTRQSKLESELKRLAKLIGVDTIIWTK